MTKFLWPSLGKVIDRNIKEECAIQFTFMQIIESIVSNELPNIKFALKVRLNFPSSSRNEFGVNFINPFISQRRILLEWIGH